MPRFLFDAHPALHALLLAATTTTTAKSKSAGGTEAFLYILVILVLGGYLLTRPGRKRKIAQLQQARQADVGDEIVTTSGIVGRVKSMSDDRVSLEIAPGTTIEVLKSAIGRRIEPPYEPPPINDSGGLDEPHDDGAPTAGGTS